MSYITFLTVYCLLCIIDEIILRHTVFETKMSIITFICKSFNHLKSLHTTFYNGKKVFFLMCSNLDTYLIQEGSVI